MNGIETRKRKYRNNAHKENSKNTLMLSFKVGVISLTNATKWAIYSSQDTKQTTQIEKITQIPIDIHLK